MKIKSLLILSILTLLITACTNDSSELMQEFPPEGFSYAAGELSFPVSVNGVIVQVTDVQIFAGDEHVTSGYVYVVPTINITNRSNETVESDQFLMLDEYQNEYLSWQTNVSFADSLQAMPEFINPNEATTGQQVFIVPSPALNAHMKVRWQSIPHESRIDVSVGPLQQ